MLVIVGLIVLLVAVLVALIGVLGNSGPAHPLTENFSVFGYHVTGSTGTLFLFGILIGAVAMLRLIGFLSVIVGVKLPAVLALQYVALFGAIAAGGWQISRGQAIEPASVVSKIATLIGERLAKVTAS